MAKRILPKKSAKSRRYVLIWRNKFLTTEATSIGEMAKILREASENLEAMEKAGVTLEDGGVEDDYAFLVTEDAKVAKNFGMEREEVES